MATEISVQEAMRLYQQALKNEDEKRELVAQAQDALLSAEYETHKAHKVLMDALRAEQV